MAAVTSSSTSSLAKVFGCCSTSSPPPSVPTASQIIPKNSTVPSGVNAINSFPSGTCNCAALSKLVESLEAEIKSLKREKALLTSEVVAYAPGGALYTTFPPC